MAELKDSLLAVGEGVGLVEVADSEVVREVFTELTNATGADGVQFAPAEVESVSHISENLVDVAQGVALPVATVLVMYAGLKKMFEGVTGKRRRAA